MNASEVFGRSNIYVIADNCSDELIDFIRTEGFSFEQTSLGNSPSFKYALIKAVKEYGDDDIIYFLEDDYLHLQGSRELITEGLDIADYVTLYDHYDQYMKYPPEKSAAPLNRWNFHSWRIFLTEHSHWRETPSTTMTFAARVKTLKKDYKILMDNPDKGTPNDFQMFMMLTKQNSFIDIVKIMAARFKRITILMLLNKIAFFRKKRLLISSIPGRSTHCEKKWLSPLTDWTKV